MIRDLAGTGSINSHADVLVIGAGTAGLIIATQIAARGRRVVCLESGGRDQIDDTHPLNAVEQIGTPYSGAENGRFRCLGGSSTRWGGALIPFQESDLDDARWPISWIELSPYIAHIEDLFGLPKGAYDEPHIVPSSNHIARLAKWPAFRKRNVYSLMHDCVNASERLEIWINATATTFIAEDDRLTHVTAEAMDGSKITVSADEVVIAAGAIESTRLLCLVAQQNPGKVVGEGLGEGFHDHLSAYVADIEPKKRAALNRLLGFRFDQSGGMLNLRFELAPTSALRVSVPHCFAHVGFSETKGGFAALRDFLRSVQRRRMPSLAIIARLLCNLPWLARASWWRFVHRRLLYPSDSRLELHMVIEQASISQNRIGLSERTRDLFGQPIGRIDWQVRESDVAAMVQATDAFEQTWHDSALAQLGTLHRRPMIEVAYDMAKGGGIYHPGGSTRMGRTPQEGPIDRDLRVFGLPNLSLCSTSALPTGGGANPTMMLLLLAFRYVDRVACGANDNSTMSVPTITA